MEESNKSYRIRTKVGEASDKYLDVHLEQDYDSFEILSLKIRDKDTYKLHNSDYGIVVGRVLANGNFGVPNAKISIFIEADEQNSSLEMWNLYPYTSTTTKDDNGIRYNLLPDESVKDCHKAVGTFPNKMFLLDNDATLEVFDEYYKYTTRTNNSGDYLLCGIPTGTHTIHMDLDLSDCGILSQRPRDFVYKGYTIEQFENPNQFKKDENLDSLAQIFSQNMPVDVRPFWGNASNGEEIGITRADIDVNFKFEPTCVFMGSAISDNTSNGVGMKCVPTNQMGLMGELTAGEGTIEMIRKTPGGNVEEFTIKGNQLINGNGVWCYQIPMNLDYMMTDEYGNMVPTDDPEKGIPTRTRVRFRASLTDMEESSQSYFRAKYLIPNNPGVDDDYVDYDFGTNTKEESYRDLFWNGVYTVKSYIPRFQKSKRWKNERFSGIKECNFYGTNNPFPYNNLRIVLPFMFTILCIFVRMFIKIISLVNNLFSRLLRLVGGDLDDSREFHCIFIGDGLCPEMEGWYFSPNCGNLLKNTKRQNNLRKNTLKVALNKDADKMTRADDASMDYQNTSPDENESACLTVDTDYLLACFEMALAQEYRVIKFDFYNDWINGVIYFPRWMRKIKRKKSYRFSFEEGGIVTIYKDKIKGCMNAPRSSAKTRWYTQQCSLSYTGKTNSPWSSVSTKIPCTEKVKESKCHKKPGMGQTPIFGDKAGLVTEKETMLGQFVYYLKPCEWSSNKKRTLLFATDIILLGTLNDCDENGIPQSFKFLDGTSYIMPTNLALTTMDDESYIFSDNNGTVCFSNHKSESSNYDPARLIAPGYESTSKAYEGSEYDKIIYTEQEESIPVTEAAGITWNYAGPGQLDITPNTKIHPYNGRNNFTEILNTELKSLYYPGGHFLGLSCVNSQTNIKSCVNLKRICELGAAMSQRREVIKNYNYSVESGFTPEYYYYVPTGLISNVDIEAASFRSMFATLNHRKLIATNLDEKTGYRKYDFRYLRPDGFDGALAKYVHAAGSPYNNYIGQYVEDAKEVFLRKSWGWKEPDDYDLNEPTNTARRTIEDLVNDYYMFRFGLEDFTNTEQKKRYLINESSQHSMPQYENSFYFYFGLKGGATAIDEFKKQFFSECEANSVTKEPNIAIEQTPNDSEFVPNVGLFIENMVFPANITIVNADNNAERATATTYNYYTDITNNDYIPGNEYIVTVTDALLQTRTTSFTYGDVIFKYNAQVVHYRYSTDNATITFDNPRKGGYLKMNDKFFVWGEEKSIIRDGIEFYYTFSESEESETTEEQIFTREMEYIDAEGETQLIYPFKNGVGKYRILYKNVNDEEEYIPIMVIGVEDNSEIDLYVRNDYLSYKNVLSGVTNSEFHNGSSRFNKDNDESWSFRHAFYRQTADDNEGFDSHIYTKTEDAEIAIFGQPEKGGLTNSGEVMTTIYNEKDYDLYQGYSIDTEYSFIPTMYWPSANVCARTPFDAMVYTDDGRTAADAAPVILTDIRQVGLNLNLTCEFIGSGTKEEYGIEEGRGCIVVLENGTIMFPIVTVATGNKILMKVYNTENPYSGLTGDTLDTLLKLATIYPTCQVPVIYKPFYADIYAATWNLPGVELTETSYVSAYKIDLPVSYKFEGTIHNGVSFGNRFYSGDTSDNLETFLMFSNSSGNQIYNYLSAQTAGNTDDCDFIFDRKINFGKGPITGEGMLFYRQISPFLTEPEKYQDTTAISYKITENRPKNDGKIYFDEDTDSLAEISGNYSMNYIFPENLRIFSYTKSLENGDCCLVADSIPNPSSTTIYLVKNDNDNQSSVFTDYSKQFLNKSQNGTYYIPGVYNGNIKYQDWNSVGTETTAIAGGYSSRNTWTSLTIYYRDDSGVTQSCTSTSLDGYNKEAVIDNLYNSGVSIYREYFINSSIASNLISNIETIIGNTGITKAITVGTIGPNGEPVGNPFRMSNGIREYNAVICKYIDLSSKGKVTLYKLYPIGGLNKNDYKSPSSIHISPNRADVGGCFNRVRVEINSPVNFKVYSVGGADWVHPLPLENLPASTTYKKFDIEENPDDEGSTSRSTTLRFEPEDPDSEIGAVNFEIEQGTEKPKGGCDGPDGDLEPDEP